MLARVNFTTLLLGHMDDHAKARLPEALDRMDHASRLFTCMSIEPKDQKRLWELCADNEPLDASHFVPAGTPPLKEVIHHGKNTLPLHNFFQKRFCLPEEGSTKLFGYNQHSLLTFTGPGYYVAHPVDRETDRVAPSDYVIDYTLEPTSKVAAPQDPPQQGQARLLGVRGHEGLHAQGQRARQHWPRVQGRSLHRELLHLVPRRPGGVRLEPP